MQAIEISGREVYDLIQQLSTRVVVLMEKVDRLDRVSHQTSLPIWSMAAAWAAVAVIFVKEFLI
jgi:hypothetical protein